MRIGIRIISSTAVAAMLFGVTGCKNQPEHSHEDHSSGENVEDHESLEHPEHPE